MDSFMAGDSIASGVLLGTFFISLALFGIRCGFRRSSASEWLFEGIRWTLGTPGFWLAKKGISPSALSWTGLFFSVVAGVAVAFGMFGFASVAAAFSGALDVWDGMVARASQKSSPRGVILDSSLDRYADSFFIFGFVFFFRSAPFLLIVSLLALVGSYMVSYATAKAEAMHLSSSDSGMKRPVRWGILMAGAALSPFTEALSLSIAIGLVAVFANIAAVLRLRRLADESSRP
jgi:CDP-diacylglycerol--glycerol-3-phosphate 3-phosphatidyltransferase